MGHKKNLLKSKFNNCFSCGCDLKTQEYKISHRINQNKNITENNIVILCPKCKYKFSLGGEKIYLVNIKKEILDKYFKSQDKGYKNIILKALQLQRDKYGKI